MNTLWYSSEAKEWEESLPLGNGRIGAMVFSGVQCEKISLNDDTLWSGFPQEHNITGASEDYKATQKLALAGMYKEAQQLVETKLLSKNSQRYLPMCDLLFEISPICSNVTKYSRTLCLETATHTTEYITDDGITYTRECFVSAADQVMVMRLSSSERLNLIARFESQLPNNTITTNNTLVLSGMADTEQAVEKQGIKFAVVANFEVIGGSSIPHNNTFHINNASDVVVRICCRTNFSDPFTPPGITNISHTAQAESDMQNALIRNYKTLKQRHIADYQSLFKRVDISFGVGQTHLSTPKRLENWETCENDPALFALLFQYGRYLMISGSRPGSQPLNLQGIWNPHFYAPWNSNYTININTQMNYWPAEVTNLSECHEPLISHILNLRKSGAKTAKIHYNAGGFTVHHNTDIWAMSTPVEPIEGGARWAFWPLGAGWLSSHAYMHYEYTQDLHFLRNTGFPIIKDAAQFFLDVLVEDIDGTLIFTPSTSPENDFVVDGGAFSVCKTTTMTTAIIKKTLQHAISCCKILQTEQVFMAEAEAALVRLPEYKIGSHGELLEWSEELPEHEPTHRHTSHLYPLYPGNEIMPNTPLAAAAARTLDLRGDESTGWALAWRINLWARLLNGERAFQFLKKQVRPCEGWQGGCYPNMFGSHPPFQIDSNFGATAGIAELLLQCPQVGAINILPAIPIALNSGYVTGLRAKGGVTVDIWFENGKTKKAELVLDSHLSAKKFFVSYNNKNITIMLKPGIIESIY